MVTPERGLRVIDGLLTGLHEPHASHLAMLEALPGACHLQVAYAEAFKGGYLWHEFGDLRLILLIMDLSEHTIHNCTNGRQRT